MNGTGIKGGAFGFKISSINKASYATHHSDMSNPNPAC